jgi:phage terminase small subunit
MARKNPSTHDLNEQQQAFCDEYVVDLNITKAAQRAGYSLKTAHAQGSRLLKNVKVSKRIQALMDARTKRTNIAADGVLVELGKIGYADIRPIFNEESGTLKHIKDWPEDLARACASIEIVETFEFVGKEKIWSGYIKKVKFWDKPRSLELLGKNQKLFTEKFEVERKLTLAELVAGSEEQEEES